MKLTRKDITVIKDIRAALKSRKYLRSEKGFLWRDMFIKVYKNRLSKVDGQLYLDGKPTTMYDLITALIERTKLSYPDSTIEPLEARLNFYLTNCKQESRKGKKELKG